MVDFNVPVPSAPAAMSPVEAIQAGQEIRLRNAQLLAYQEQARQRHLENERLAATQTLAKAAIAGDPNSLAQLSVLAPDMAKGVRDYNNYKITRSGQLWQSVTTAPKPVRGKLYQQAIQQYQNEFGETPNVPAEYSPEADEYLKGLITQSRDVEKVAQDEFQRPLQEQKVISELMSQQKTKADIAKTYTDITKTKEEINVAREEREAAKNLGLTSSAYKSYQTNLGQNLADRNKPLSQESAKVLGLAQGGTDILKQIENQFFDPKTGAFQKAKFGKATAGANLPNIVASEDAQAFETRRQNLSDLIGRMRSGGAINKDEKTRFLKLIPRFGDKEQTVKNKMSQLNKEFTSIQKSIDPYGTKSQNYSNSPTSGGGGEDPLGIR